MVAALLRHGEPACIHASRCGMGGREDEVGEGLFLLSKNNNLLNFSVKNIILGFGLR